MKAIQIQHFGGPEVLEVKQIADPKAGAGQVVVRAKAIGINPVDTYIRAGKYGDRSFPFTPGLDAAGIVESVGSDVRSVKVGERVFVSRSVSGTYSELILCAESHVHPLSKKLSFAQGAAIGVPYATAYFGLMNRGQAKSGETVLVHGASGGVGTAAVQIASSRGLTVIGTGGTPRGRELVQKEGAKHVLDHHAPDFVDHVKKLTGGKGVNLILEMLANVNLGKDLKMLAPHGRVVVIGSRGPVEIDPRDTFLPHSDIRGMSLMTVSDGELQNVYEAMAKDFDQGKLNPIIGKEIPFDEVSRAHEEVMTPGAYGKIVLVL